jgi:hypothetical protein
MVLYARAIKTTTVAGVEKGCGSWLGFSTSSIRFPTLSQKEPIYAASKPKIQKGMGAVRKLAVN